MNVYENIYFFYLKVQVLFYFLILKELKTCFLAPENTVVPKPSDEVSPAPKIII